MQVYLRMLYYGFNAILAPLVPEIASYYHVSIALAAESIAISPFAWGVTGLAVGPIADRIGDKAFIVSGTALMGLLSIACTLAPNFLLFSAMRLVAGIAGGWAGPTSQAYIVKRWQSHRQTQILGLAAAGYMAGGIVVLPALSVVAQHFGWQSALNVLGFLLVSASLACLFILKPVHARFIVQTSYFNAIFGQFRSNPKILWLLIANLFERVENGVFTAFFPIMLRVVYHLNLDATAIVLAIVGICAAAGSIAGGSALSGALAGSIERIYQYAMFVCAILTVAIFAIKGIYLLSITLGSLYIFIDSGVRPAYLRLIGIASHLRSTTMGWNAFGNQFGGVIGAALPALLLALIGFLSAALISTAVGVFAGLAMHKASRLPLMT